MAVEINVPIYCLMKSLIKSTRLVVHIVSIFVHFAKGLIGYIKQEQEWRIKL